MADSNSIKVLIKEYGSEQYASKVAEEPLTDYPMFIKSIFRDESWFPFLNFSIIANATTYNYNPEHRSLLYKNDLIFYIEIFVHKNNVNKPLLVGVNNGSKYYYFRISESDCTKNKLELDHPCEYSIATFFDALLDEHEKTNELFTFRIDKTIDYNGIRVTNGNQGRFPSCIHVPKNGSNQYEPVVLSGRNRILEEEILENFLGKKFDHMTVYYKDKVKYSEIPLMIEFSFSGQKFYYHRNNIYDNWTKTEFEDNEQLESKLEEIETQLFYFVSVSIYEKRDYTTGVVMDHTHTKGSGDTDKEKIKVGKYGKYSVQNYVCYEHNLSIYIKEGIKWTERAFGHQFKLLIVNICNRLIKITHNQRDLPIIFVEECSKFYVWFYNGADNSNEDNLPLMIEYNNKMYAPKSREDYLNHWVEIDHIVTTFQNNEKLIEELDRVNFMLNAIDLNYKIIDTTVTSKYGILKSTDLNESFDTNRILVEYKTYRNLFFNCIHTTKNRFMIGKAHYTKQIYYQRGTEQKHHSKTKLSKNEKIKSPLEVRSREVSVYYFKYDRDCEYPLILEFKLYDNHFDYYVLRCDFRDKAIYEFRRLTLGPKIEDNDLSTILTHQNFIIHQVVNIKLDKLSAYACCDDLKDNKHLTFVPGKVRGPKSCRFIGENYHDTANLPFIKVSGYHSNLLYGYFYYEHGLTTFTAYNNKGVKAKTLDKIKIIGFQIRNIDLKLNGLGLKGHTFVKAPYVFVFFYRHDPRPLMVCCNHKAYVPEGLSNYQSDWYPVNSPKKFTIISQQHINFLDTDLLNKLTETVGFLNTVNLYQHNKDDNNHIYTVHTYYGIHIRVKVTNEPLFTDKQSGIITCYKKLTHTPNGTKGRDPKDFRLGNIEYNGNEVTGKLDYTKGNYKWDPLTSVSVYYYNHDTKYKDPLLVELEFNISKTKEIKLVKQYYKLKTCDGNNLEWEEDNNSLNSVIRDNVKLAKYLDDIRYRFKKVLKIEMDKQNSYPLMLSQNVGNADTFQKANDYKIEVEPCNNCTNLSNQDYKAFHHKISKINGGFDYNSIAGIVFTLPNTNGDIIKIPFFDSKTAKSVNNFHYDKCMGDIHVYFSKQSEPSAELPLFFNFNRKWYMPSKIENYFKGWSSYEGLEPDFEQKRLDIHKKIEDYIAKVKMIKQANKSETYTIELVKSFSEVDEIRSDNNNENSYDDLIKSYLNIDISDKYKERSDVGTETFTDNDLKSYIDVSKKPPANDLEIPNFHDLETSPLNDLEMPYSNEVQLPPIYNLKIPSDDDLEISPVNDSKISHARDLNIPYPHHLAVSPVDLKTSHVDIERPDKSMKNPFVNIDISPVNEFEITSVKDINKSVEIKMPCVDLETPFVDDSDIFSVDHFKMTHPNDLEIPYFNHLTVPSVDLKQSHVTIEKPFDDTKQHYIDIDMSPVNEFEITSVKDVNKSDIDTETPPDDDLEILPVKYPQTTYFSDPELESLDDKLRETLEKQSCIDKDQSKQVVNFKVLDFTQDDNKHVTLDKSLTEHSDDEKFSKPDFFPDPLASPLASTGLASTSADSDNSYLGPILGGTFGLLVTLGLFTFMLFKYFRRVRLRNMIPQLY